MLADVNDVGTASADSELACSSSTLSALTLTTLLPATGRPQSAQTTPSAVARPLGYGESGARVESRLRACASVPRL
jgi:hypothetical protein